MVETLSVEQPVVDLEADATQVTEGAQRLGRLEILGFVDRGLGAKSVLLFEIV